MSTLINFNMLLILTILGLFQNDDMFEVREIYFSSNNDQCMAN